MVELVVLAVADATHLKVQGLERLVRELQVALDIKMLLVEVAEAEPTKQDNGSK
jgi:hypothetical protein